MFAHTLKWFDDPYCLSMDPRRFMLQMSMYAQHLATGSTLLCRSIKVGTVKVYLRQVIGFFMRFGRWKRNPCFAPTSDSYYGELKSVLAELTRWEKVPNRREPFTLDMLASMYTEDYGYIEHSSKFACVRDQCGAGTFDGRRKTEFCQEAGQSDPSFPMKDIYGDTKAFTLLDVKWELDDKTRLIGASVLLYPCSRVKSAKLLFRTQKNGQNGEERSFTSPGDETNLSWISFTYSIVRRFVALRGPDDFTTPLSVYKDDDGSVKLLTSSDVEKIMRLVAAHVYNLDPNTAAGHKQLQLWSCHSIRVGACVLLHSRGFTDTQIQWILRWRSMAFLVYLRNIDVLCDKHVEAFNAALEGMPNLSIN